MTDTSTAVNVIENKSSHDEKKIISRLLIQKILSSDATRFMRKESFDGLSKRLLSETPDDEMTVNYRLQGTKDSYYATIVDLNIKWVSGQNELVDLDGNAWTTYTLQVSPGIGNSYSNTIEQFRDRASCMGLVKDLVDEITEMVPGPIRVLFLNNEERVARDNKRKYEAVCEKFSSELRSYRKDFRVGLRTNGKARAIGRADDLMMGVPPGRYEFAINDGTQRRPKFKRYVVTVPTIETYYAAIKRVA